MKKNRIPVFILCGALALSFAGCKAKKEETTSDTQTESTTSATSATETTVPETTEAKADNSDDEYVSQYSAFIVTSNSLHDGYWDEATSNAGYNKSASPELSWDPVEGASCYVIYMIDIHANCFLHWKQGGITETSLPEGQAERKNYVGPYPPSGATHQYNVYVIALRNPVEKLEGSLRNGFPEFADALQAMDTDSDGNTGNIVAVGKISGLFKG